MQLDCRKCNVVTYTFLKPKKSTTVACCQWSRWNFLLNIWSVSLRFYPNLNHVVEILNTNWVRLSILTSMVRVPRFRCLLIPQVKCKKRHVNFTEKEDYSRTRESIMATILSPSSSVKRWYIPGGRTSRSPGSIARRIQASVNISLKSERILGLVKPARWWSYITSHVEETRTRYNVADFFFLMHMSEN